MAFHTPPSPPSPGPKRSPHLRVVQPPIHPNVFEETEGACRLACNPCTQTQCRYHLGVRNLDAALLSGDETLPTCALEVAGNGPHTLEDISQLLGVTKERVRQLEAAALRKLRASHSEAELRSLIDSGRNHAASTQGAKSDHYGFGTSGLGDADCWGFDQPSLLRH